MANTLRGMMAGKSVSSRAGCGRLGSVRDHKAKSGIRQNRGQPRSSEAEKTQGHTG